MSVIMARLEHARQLGYCARGLRRWLTEQGIAWSTFLAEGVSVHWLRASGDAMAIRLAEQAEQENANGRQRR